MVDIAFLLLIFFLVATTIVPVEQDLAMALPTPNGKPAAPTLPLLIEVAADQSVWWGEEESRFQVVRPEDGRELGELKSMLGSAIQADSLMSSKVLLKIDDGVTQQRFTDVLNTLAGQGVEQVGLIGGD